jgi:hypothetical protein
MHFILQNTSFSQYPWSMDNAKASMIRNISWSEEMHSPYKSPHQIVFTTKKGFFARPQVMK